MFDSYYGNCSKILNTRPRYTTQTEIRLLVLPVCYSDKHFVSSSPDNHYFIGEQKEKSVQNFRTFTVLQCINLMMERN